MPRSCLLSLSLSLSLSPGTEEPGSVLSRLPARVLLPEGSAGQVKRELAFSLSLSLSLIRASGSVKTPASSPPRTSCAGEGCEIRVARYPFALLCFALLCFALLCFALLCFALLCFALLCFALLCFALLCFALLCFALLCFALLCFALLCFALLCFALLCFALLCFALLCFALLCFALLCFALLCFALLCFALLCFALLCFALLCFALLCFALLCFALLCFASGLSRKQTLQPALSRYPIQHFVWMGSAVRVHGCLVVKKGTSASVGASLLKQEPSPERTCHKVPRGSNQVGRLSFKGFRGKYVPELNGPPLVCWVGHPSCLVHGCKSKCPRKANSRLPDFFKRVPQVVGGWNGTRKELSSELLFTRIECLTKD